MLSPASSLKRIGCVCIGAKSRRTTTPTPAFLFPELNRMPPSGSLADRRRTAAAIFTDPRNGRMPRTLVNRIWHRLLGTRHRREPGRDGWRSRGVPNCSTGSRATSSTGGYDLKRLMATIVSSQAYQMRAVPRVGEQPRGYVFRGPEVRRLTAEQFGDAIGAITGDWNVYQPPARTNQPRRCDSRCHRARRPDGTRVNGKRPPVRWRARLVGRFATRSSRHATRLRRRFKRSNWSTASGWRTGCFAARETCSASFRRRRLPCS